MNYIMYIRRYLKCWFKVLQNEYRKKLEEIQEEIIDVIGTEIFNMKSVEDL